MIAVDLQPHSDFDDWQPVARHLLHRQAAPDTVAWQSLAIDDLFAGTEIISPALIADSSSNEDSRVRVPRAFVQTARLVACHRSPERFSLLYRILWRIVHQQRSLMDDASDPDVCRALRWAKEVSRERHKMHAFVRFREVRVREAQRANEKRSGRNELLAGDQGASDPSSEESFYIAWFEPEHYSLKLSSDFFRKRFFTMRWSILTPYQSAHWDGAKLTFGRGCARDEAPDEDRLEDYWRVYYAHIFNPARLMVEAMRNEMPKKFWKNLPEASLIAPLIRSARQREAAMVAQPGSAQGVLPDATRFDRDAFLRHRRSEEHNSRRGPTSDADDDGAAPRTGSA